MTMRARPLLLTACLLAAGARAETRLLALAETDSYQLLTLGISAFGQAAGLPFALTQINDDASSVLLVPNLAGVDVKNHMWLCWVMLDQTNAEARTLCSAAVLPTVDSGNLALAALGECYEERTRDEENGLLCFTRPKPGLATAPSVYAATRRGHLVVSASRAAAAWVARNPLPVPAGTPAIVGQIRVQVQPRTIATLLKAAREQRVAGVQIDTLSDTVENLMADVQTLSLLLETANEGATLRLTAVPRPQSPLAALAARARPPEPRFWSIMPDNIPVAFASGGVGVPALLEAYAPTNRPAAGSRATLESVMGKLLTGDSAMYVARAGETGGVYVAVLRGVTDGARAWAAAQEHPGTLLPFLSTFVLVTNGTRTVAGCPVMDMSLSDTRRITSVADVGRDPVDLLAFMLKDGGMSVAAASNLLVVTFGPRPGLDLALTYALNPSAAARPLPVRCRTVLPGTPQEPCSALLLRPIALVRDIAGSLPAMRPERIAALPRSGNGLAAMLSRTPDGALTVELRMAADEVARVQDAMSEGRAALQEMFMHMAVQQLLQRRVTP